MFIFHRTFSFSYCLIQNRLSHGNRYQAESRAEGSSAALKQEVSSLVRTLVKGCAYHWKRQNDQPASDL